MESMTCYIGKCANFERYINCTWDLPELEAKRKEIVDRDLLKIQMSITA